MFAPLKVAYRHQVERLERGGVGTIGKEHFTYLYNPARRIALTPRNIRAGWTAAGLFPLNRGRVLSDIPKPPAELIAGTTIEVRAGCAQDQALSPQTPVTPVSAGAVALLHDLIKKDAHMLDEVNKQRLQRHVQKLTNATTLSLAKQNLLRDQNRFLAKINNEAKVRRSTKSKIVGTARVMSYEDLEKARLERAKKEAGKEAADKAKKAKKAKQALTATPTADEAAVGKKKRGRRHKNGVGANARTLEGEAEAALVDWPQVDEGGSSSDPWRAPVARMW